MPAIPDMLDLPGVVPSDLLVVVDDPGGTPITKKATVANLLKLLHPVGSLYLSVNNTNPNILFGFGTWVAIAAGRALVSIDAGDADFDAPEKLSGVKTHALTSAQMPAHTHVQDPHTHLQNPHSHLTQRYPTATGALSGYTIDTSMSGTLADNTQPVKDATAVNQNATAVNQNAGGGTAHPNVQPSIAIYVWKRTV